MDAIKNKFIRDTLEDEGKRFVRNQGFAIRKELIFHTGKTFSDRSFKVTGQTLQIDLPIHVRFLDVRKNTTRRKVGSGYRVSKQGYRIYNRFKEGHKLSLISRITTEFTEEMIQDIRSKFNSK